LYALWATGLRADPHPDGYSLANFGGSVDELIAHAGARGREAVDAVGEMGGNLVDNVEEAIRERPLTALAIAVGLGFVLSSTMRR
jgi:ElaB/YqjD/DUF883 family membrane-anchored ribosome-binding protein